MPPPAKERPGTWIHHEVEDEALQDVKMIMTSDLTIEGQMTVRGSEIDFPTVIVSRLGGPSAQDHEFRQRLYQLIGAATVAGGQIESQMKRLLVLLDGSEKRSFNAEIEGMWGKVAKRLRAAAINARETDSTARDAFGRRPESMPTKILTALDWAEEQEVGEARNHIVHAAWWDYAGTGVTRSRFHLSGKSELHYLDWERLEGDCNNLQEFLRMLDEIIGDRWSRFDLPISPALPSG
jgi:hypothetical protein